VRAFLTGGSGFVGGALLRHLVDEGHHVRGSARSAAAATRIRAGGGTAVEVDLFDEAGLAAAMAGCEVVFHVAGVNRMCTRDLATLHRVNVGGAMAALRAAAAAGVPRFVLTSSAAAVGEPRGVVADETTPPAEFPSRYARAKRLGEEAVLAAAPRLDVEAVVVNPVSVQGPGRVGGSARLLRYALTTRRPLVLDTVVSVVDVADCVRGHVLAARHGRAGARYLLSGASVSLRELVASLAEAAGREIWPIVVPRSLVAAGMPLAWLAGRLRPEGVLCPDALRTLLHGHRLDGGRATRELGLRYTPLSDTLVRTVAWYRELGLLDGRG